MKTYFLPLILLFQYATAQEVNIPANTRTENGTDLLRHRWKASWIAHPTASQTDYGVFLFRNKIGLHRLPEHFIIYVSADNRYRLYVNGIYITGGPARGDVLNWRYEELDIVKYLKTGENTIAAEVVNYGNDRPLAQHTFQTAFILQTADSAYESLNTGNETWRVIRNNAYHPLKISTSAVNGFIATGPCDSIVGKQFPWNWNMPGFDDRKWERAEITFADKSKEFNGVGRGYAYGAGLYLVPRSIPLLEQKPEHFSRVVKSNNKAEKNDGFIAGTPTVIGKNSKVSFLLDQNYLTVGYPQLLTSKGAGSRIKITYAEALWNKDGTKGNRNITEGKEMQGYYDVYLPDGGMNRMFQPLWLRTFRYVQLEIETSNEELVLNDYHNIFTAYPFTQKASFSSDNPKLKQIWDIGWRTARLCAGETYFDCPYYEQLQYIGDTRIQSLVSLYVTGDDRLMRNAIELFDRSRTADGLTLSRYPSYYPQVIPTFSLLWVGMIHDYYMYRQDSAFISQFSQGMKDVLNWFENRVGANGMMGSVEWWNFTDWAPQFKIGIPDGADKGGSALITLQYVYALQHAAELFAYLDQPYYAEKYSKLAEKLKKSVVDNCYDKDKGLIAETPEKKSFSMHTSIFAVLTNTIEEKQQADVIRKIMADDDLIKPTIYFQFYLFRALQQTGLGDMYLEKLTSWYSMIDQGLTTFAEEDLKPRSDCHAWSASPLFDFLHTVAGIQPAIPGFGKVLIAPNFGSLKTIDATMPHPKGEIIMHLDKGANNDVRGFVSLPPGVTGTFRYKGVDKVLNGGKQEIDY
jgi:alpha-L-rhamnosidase